jgi:hypothetical protein
MCNPVTTYNPGALLSKGMYRCYEWEVVCNPLGFRCGYVRIPRGHLWHGKDYSEVNASVHGGLNFAEADSHCGKGGDDNAWWLGFSCDHVLIDAPDPALPTYDKQEAEFMSRVMTWDDWPAQVIRDTPFVEAECKRLIDQAAKAERRNAYR